MDFIDSEAEESDEEVQVPNRKKFKKMEESDDEEEDDEERLREELKDLIDDNPIEDDSDAESDASGGKQHKKSDDEDFDDRLEDDDYDLLEENLGVKVQRKRFKRLRKQDESDAEEDADDLTENREKIANELFDSGDDDEKRSERSHRPEVTETTFNEEGSDIGDSDNDDFIVDDDGVPINQKRKKKFKHSDSAIQAAQEVFGVDFDYDDFAQHDEADEEDEDDEEDIYDVEDESGERAPRPKKKQKHRKTKTSIFEIYEPSELKRGGFTDLDNEIRTKDVPERMQLRTVPITSATPEEIDREAEWIYKYAFCKPTISITDGHLNEEAKERARKGPETIPKIKKVLDFLRNQLFEVPFISFYRKEYVLPELNINDLWKIYRYDAKWCSLEQRKEHLLKLFEKMRNFQMDQIMANRDAELPENIRLINDEDIERLKEAESPEEFKDVQKHFMLYYARDIPAMQEAARAKERAEKLEKKRLEAQENGEDGPQEVAEDEDPEEMSLKPSVRTGPYEICRKAGLEGFAKRFGLTPEKFAINLRDCYQKYEVEQEPADPSTVAAEYVSDTCKTVEEVINAVKLMVAIQLAREPLVRKCAREAYMKKATITVRPTKKGMKEIDENHQIYTIKYLKDKPVRTLIGDQYLKLQMAKEDKLVELTFSDTIEGDTSTSSRRISYVDEIKSLYKKDEYSKSVQEWDALRAACVQMAIENYVFKDLKEELHANLIAESKECVMRACCRKMYNWLKTAPYTIESWEEDEDWDKSKGLRVMGIAYVPDYSQAAFACIVSPEGECTDYLRLPHLMKRKNSYREAEKVMKEADLLALRNLIATKKPHVVVVGGESRDATRVVEDIREVITALTQEEEFPEIPVEILENDFSKIYSNSIKGSNDFRDYPELLRQAISLARRLQDPLMEFSQLCSEDEEILCLRFHPLQEQLPKEELLENIYLEFVNRVNEVGVDFNKALNLPYASNLVQFVCGLGPRKGQALIKLLKQTIKRLENRTQFVTSCHMGPKVFINCAGFIKIDTNSLGDSTEAYVEVLDSSRVHPETYEWARKMAVDALEYEDEEEVTNPAGAVEEILESPERLKDLDLDAFAEELERQGFGNKAITLYDIRAELNCRYKDLRAPYQPPPPEVLFDILTKESPETFYIGKLIMASVIGITHKKPQGEQLDQANPVRNDETGLWQCPFCLKNDFPELSEVWNHFDAGSCPGKGTGVRLRLDNGISGYIHIKNLSDKHVANPEERVVIGQVIHCRIIKIEVDRFSVECTCKSSDLSDKKHEWRPQKDIYYDAEAEERDRRTEEDSKKNKTRQIYQKRVIVHPSFHNVGFVEAEKMMKTMKQGDAIVRPSSKGSDRLTVTWKVTDDIYQHVDVREEGKENSFSLGQTLWIGNEEFEDLDEIIARYINPMAACAQELLDFKYYKPNVLGMRDIAEEDLKAQKEANPNGIPYILSAAKNYPGKFMLSYLPRLRCRHEYVTVTDKGFRFRGQMFGRVSEFFRWFKEHFRDPIPGQATPSTPRGAMTARTPYSTGTPGPMPSGTMGNVTSSSPAAVGMHAYQNTTPYTPSGQTPFMTPYQMAPPSFQVTPRYQQQSNQFAHPGQQSMPPPVSHPPTTPTASRDNDNWEKATQSWSSRPPHQSVRSSSSGTPRFDARKVPRDRSYEDRRRKNPYSPRSTPNTNASPRSMSLSGDGTPLYDES